MTGSSDLSPLNSIAGTRVRVHTADRSYTGWVYRWYSEPSGLLLYDAERGDGDQFGEVFVTDPVSVERVDDDKSLERVPVAEIAPSPYNVREYDDGVIDTWVRRYREKGNLFAFPVVRPVDGGSYEIVSGHRRIRGAREADLDVVPVVVRELSDWEATKHFVFEHVALPSERHEGDAEFYSASETHQLFETLLEDWPIEKLRELRPLEPEVRSHGE